VNPILAEGEIVIEAPDSGVGTGLSRFKIGDGVTRYKQLPYAFDGASAHEIIGGDPNTFNLITLRSGSAALWTSVNPVLSLGEPGFDTTNNSIKIGDGVKRWTELKYIDAGDSVTGDYDFGDEGTN
jgi:hypothetical protein